jgi:uncharacterized protein YqiB (DUF1249 family)
MSQHFTLTSGYKPRISCLMSLYEENYRRLMQLIPQFRKAPGNARPDPDGSQPPLSLELLEQHKYTSVIALAQSIPAAEGLVPRLRMIVRVYHDAGLAEVTSYQNETRFDPVYPFPNRQMRQPDEKQQVNRLLGEWLEHCLAQGHIVVSVEAIAGTP